MDLNGQNLSIENCYNSGEIVTNAENGRASGILGIINDESNVSNVFNIGKITLENGKYESASSGAGGILGITLIGANNAEINYAYNTGIIELKNTTNQRIGSIIGSRNSAITISNCYFLTGTYDVSVGYGNDTGITELDSIDKFPTVLSVVNGEGAFKEDTEGINNGYPVLDYQ